MSSETKIQNVLIPTDSEPTSEDEETNISMDDADSDSPLSEPSDEKPHTDTGNESIAGKQPPSPKVAQTEPKIPPTKPTKTIAKKKKKSSEQKKNKSSQPKKVAGGKTLARNTELT